jgi:hypothetical protein
MDKKEYHRQWRENNKEKLRKYWAEYRKKNSDKLKEYMKEYRKDNKEKFLECAKKWAKKQRLKEPMKVKARNLANNKIKIGENEFCELCENKKAVHKHHKDYSKPLDVVKVCIECHKSIHKESEKFVQHKFCM